MKKLLLILILFNCYCGKTTTNPEEFIFEAVKADLIDAERQRKKCESIKAYWLLTVDPNDREAIIKILTYDCYESAYGYKKPNYSSSSQNKNTIEN